MFCGQCGTNNVEDVKFCVKCGADLTKMAPNKQRQALQHKSADSPANRGSLEASTRPNDRSKPVGQAAQGQSPQHAKTNETNPTPNPDASIPVNLCPKCGVDNPAKSLTCKSCGNTLFKKCPYCGYANESNKKYCGVCGSNTQEQINYEETPAKAGLEKERKYIRAMMEYKIILIGEPNNAEAGRAVKRISDTINKLESLRLEAEHDWQDENYEKARDNYQQILKIMPDYEKIPESLNQVPELIRQRDIKRLTEAINKAMAENDFNPALDQARKLLAIDPQSEFAGSIIEIIENKKGVHQNLQEVKQEAKRQLRHVGIILAVLAVIILAIYVFISYNNNRNHLKAGRQLMARQKYGEALRELEACGSFGIDTNIKTKLINQAAEAMLPSWLSQAQADYGRQDYQSALDSVNSALRYRPNDPILLDLKSKISPEAGFILKGFNEQGFTEFLHQQTDLVFVLIPKSTYMMGNNESTDAKPLHKVNLKRFYISKYEVTQSAWKKAMGDNPARFKLSENCPVEQVSWTDCQKFCAKTGLRLPTEAEWEYACRGKSASKFYWGNNEDNGYMWFEKSSESTTHPAGQKKPNMFGLFDISGNVCEWCSDWYDGEYYKSSPPENPTGPASGQFRVVRGGSWNDPANDTASAYRYWLDPNNRTEFVGFRCVKDAR